ncbi:MAG TPA: formylmethanofuran--tetrahydromethanopterin N-formyltransferase [Acidobacteriota bacterium]|nr:formylmethanofuran--tetrahydromethanopterin N-formyltransferase [Acidobacteriota bacterium]
MTQCINGVEIEDTFAEAFGMWGARVIITAVNQRWAREAAAQLTGFATSVIACGCEAGIEADVAQTPDGRPGVSILIFAMGKESLVRQLTNRIGQCVLTCPTTACFNGLTGEEEVSIGGQLRFFGDGFQSSKLIGGRRYWRIPVMEGEFLVEDRFGLQRAVGGGNFLILGSDQKVALQAAELAVEAMQRVPGVVMPFPGGIVRSGSKVGSRYKFLKASTNDAYCPSLRGMATSALPDGVHSVFEIVIDGLDVPSIETATRAGILAACIPGIRRISAGNYGGNLGKFKFHLRKILDEAATA